MINANGNNYLIKLIQFDVIKNGYKIRSDNSVYETEFFNFDNIKIFGKIIKSIQNL